MRKGMEHLLDWHLVYRTGPRMLSLKPRQAGEEAASVHSDETGVNVFFEVRKPNG
jgi:extracellular factor (EF) 3-hydroxypalmitic acid methyl ester biosynthesis protein